MRKTAAIVLFALLIWYALEVFLESHPDFAAALQPQTEITIDP